MNNFENKHNGEVLPEQESFGELVKKIDATDMVVYERLNATNTKEAKAEFLANESLTKPNNVRGNLDAELVGSNLATLEETEELLQKEDCELSDKEKRFAQLLVDDHRKKNEFLAANIAYNEAKTPEEKEMAAQMHHETNEALYGAIDESTFYTLLNARLSDVKAETPEDQANLEKLKSLIGDIPAEKLKSLEEDLPSSELVSRFAEIVNDFYGNFLEYVPDEKEKPQLGADEVVDIMNTILTKEFADEESEGSDEAKSAYKAVVVEGATAASVNHQAREIRFPAGKTYSNMRARQLILHEMGTHAMRADAYVDNELVAVSTEVPGSEQFDEGVAKCLEAAVSGEYEMAGSSVEHYINIGLATFKGLNFREVFEAQSLLRRLHGEAETTVYPRVQRAFRGTDELPNNKDLAYYNGEVQVWKYIENHIDDPELMDHLFLMGKTDPENPEHEALAYELRTRGSLS